MTGASPVVDVQNVRRQTVVTNELLEALPTSTKSIGQLATLTTGLTGLGDVGGTYQVEPGQDVVSGGGRVPRQGGHQGVVRRHGHGEQLGQQQLPAQLRRRSKRW